MKFNLVILYQILFTVHQILIVFGHSTGAPPEACIYDGEPDHDVLPQDLDEFPYNITASGFEYGNGSEIKVSIEGTEFHRGFFIRAMDKETGKPIGLFEASEEVAQLNDCSACTHTNANKKFNSTLTWKFSGDSNGTVYFNSSVVQNYETFWVGYVTENMI